MEDTARPLTLDDVNTIHAADCLQAMNDLPAGCVDLAFADPPFNIGYEYDVYDDSLESKQYVDWSRDWIAATYRVLKPDGTFWLAIGDEYAAELKLASQDVGFHCRSWVIWYYTFGVNCRTKFSRSHAHLFHFVKDPQDFTFRGDDLVNRIPSARQLVYNDKRANPRGRLPDDTWIIRPSNAGGDVSIDELNAVGNRLDVPSDTDSTWTLRPQDLAERFQEGEDTWYFPRVAGTFKERAGFHGCQMPEQLLGRIIRVCSNDDALVLDPFSGSATTLAVAKKLGRRYLGFDISDEYAEHGLNRLESICIGDPLDGAAEPTISAPATNAPRNAKKKSEPAESASEEALREQQTAAAQREQTMRGVVEAFRISHQGFSADRVVADPELNEPFLDTCRKMGLAGDPRTWNILLFRQRKAGGLADIETTQRTLLSWAECDSWLFASEIAMRLILDERAESLDEVLCDPVLARQFLDIARPLAPGQSPLHYNWAALKLRKQAKLARTRGEALSIPSRLGKRISVTASFSPNEYPESAGVYVISNGKEPLYVGETHNVRSRLSTTFQTDGQRAVWNGLAAELTLQVREIEPVPSSTLAWQSRLAKKLQPRLNLIDLWNAG